MKHHILSSLTAILLALAVALAGVAVPRLLVRRQTDRLTTKSELLSSDQLIPYSAGTDSPVRIQKLANMAAALFNYESVDMYQNIRLPLDTELPQEAAIRMATSFLGKLLDSAEEMGLQPLSLYDDGISIYKPDEYNNFMKQREDYLACGMTTADLLSEYCYEGYFCVSPEDSSLAMWLLGIDSPAIGAILALDAATGIPIYLVLSCSGIPDGGAYLFPVIYAYQSLFPEKFADFGLQIEQSDASGLTALTPEASWDSYDDPDTQLAYYTTSSGEICLEQELPTNLGLCYGMVFRLYA